MAAANTPECIREFIGLRVVGLLLGRLPVGRRDLQIGNKTLVFEDGRGLTFAVNGSYWAESADDVRRAIRLEKEHLDRTNQDIKAVLELAGAVPDA